jgi:hypothetical protein
MDFTGHFDSLMVDLLADKQKAVLTLNEDARQAFDELKDCEKLSITIKKYRQKRSLDANSYFHVLVGKIADVLNISKPRSKNILIGRYGQPELLDDGSPAIMKTNVPVSKMLEQETLHCYPCGSKTENGQELTFYRIYRGSHTYDTKEMSILIDGTVEEAKDLGIETMTPDQINEMKQKWGVDIG